MQKQIGGKTPGPLRNHELIKRCEILTPNNAVILPKVLDEIKNS